MSSSSPTINNNKNRPSFSTASTQWAAGLADLAQNLNLSAADLQDEWHEMSEALAAQQNQVGKSPILLPDPIKLLRRIQALEIAAQKVSLTCADMEPRRKQAVQDAAEQLGRLRQLTAGSTTSNKQQQDKIEQLEVLVKAGCEQFTATGPGFDAPR